MIVRSEAIALRLLPHARTSQIVTWLTPAHGKVVTLIKGAGRPKSAFLGQYDLFYTCELLFYARDPGAVNIARECAPVATRSGLRRRWRATVAASGAADLLARVLPAGEPQPELFRLFCGMLDGLAVGEAPLARALWFELQVARIMGMPPRLDGCVACDAALAPDAAAFFDPRRGGVFCAACRPPVGARRLDAACLDTLRAWLRTRHAGELPAWSSSGHGMLEWVALFGIFLACQLEVTPRSRTIVFDLLTAEVTPQTKGSRE